MELAIIQKLSTTKMKRLRSLNMLQRSNIFVAYCIVFDQELQRSGTFQPFKNVLVIKRNIK